MKRNTFIKTLSTATAGAIGLSACQRHESNISTPHIITEKKVKWKMVTTWPPNFPVLGEGCKLLAQWIEEMSAGRIHIEVYGGGELVPPLEVFEAISSGAAEIGHGAAYYWAGIQPAFQFFTSVPFGMNAQQMNSWMIAGGGHELWQEMYARYNLVPFFAGNTGVQMGGWFNREINTLNDLKGLKMRMPGLGGKIMQRAGATAVLSPGSELYTNLERGVIDATEWIGPYHDYLMGFHEIAQYYYYPGWHEAGSVLECIVNKKDFEELSPDLQEIVRSAMYRANSWMHAQFEAQNNIYLQKIINETDVKIQAFPGEVLSTLKEHAHNIYRELATEDPLVKKVYDSFWDFKSRMIEWSELSEKIFYNQVQ